MNQTLVRMYLLILVGVLSVVGAFWPNVRGWKSRLIRFGRFSVLFALGLAIVFGGFHAPGVVDALRVDGGLGFVGERFPGRRFGSYQWTSIRLSDGRIESSASPPSSSVKPEDLEDDRPPMRLISSVRARVERPSGRAERPYEPVGPALTQPILAFATSSFAVISGYAELYQPSTVYVARIEADGQLSWKVEGRNLGLSEGRLRKALRLPGGDLLLAFTGIRAQRNFLEVLASDSHLVVVRLGTKAGRVRWTQSF